MPISNKTTESPPEKYYTNAEPDYDWGWTQVLIENAARDERNRPVRLVEISDGYHADYQVGRYASGLRFAYTQEQFDAAVKAGFLRLTPDEEIHYFRKVFDFQNVACEETKSQELMPFLRKYRKGKHPSVTLECVYRFEYLLTVKGRKEEAKVAFDGLVLELLKVLSS